MGHSNFIFVIDNGIFLNREVWKIIYLVLEMFSAILLARNQFASLFISMFILLISSGRLLPEIKLEVSSAKRKVSNSVALGRSFM